jgi:iron complex transport system substrate-binding protein
MRVVSLLPAATEWVYALGAGASLVGRSHACDHPPAAAALPALTRPAVAAGTSASIDTAVRARLRQGLSLFDLDLEALRALAPNLVLTQAQCDVCAVSLTQLEEVLAAWTDARPRLFSMEPMTFKEVLDAALRLGRALGCDAEAMRFVAAAELRLQRLRDALGLRRDTDPAGLPTVACLEWLDPLMTAGHWMPDVVELAGGRAVLAEKGTPSAYVRWSDLCAADPDVLVVAPCGFTLDQTRAVLGAPAAGAGWAQLTAVRAGRVYLFDGRAYFNRPGPRLYRSVELLAQALYPASLPPFVEPAQAWELLPLGEAAV